MSDEGKKGTSEKFAKAAAGAKPDLAAEIERLARIPEIEFFRFWKGEAKQLGIPPDDLKRLVKSRRAEIERERHRSSAPSAASAPHETWEKAGAFRSNGKWIEYLKRTPEGEAPIALTNFDARITFGRTIDDGAERRSVFVVRGTLQTGRPLPEAEVPASRFESMSWLGEHWGAQPVVLAGHKERAAVAIRLLSGETVVEETVYAHTGWRVINGKAAYLHSAAAIGAEGEVSVTVDLGGRAVGAANLDRYELRVPKNADENRMVLRASLRALDLAAIHVAAPVFGAVYLAPLSDLFPGDIRPRFSVFLVGPSGALKTAVSVIAQAHYGPFTEETLPASFSATANALEKLAFLAKDALLTVDDYHPTSNPHEERKMAEAAQRFLRGVGNSSARGRMNADGTLRPEYRPRCVGLVSGERLPAGASTLARAFVVPVVPGDVPKGPLLDAAQNAAPLYPAAMGAYVQWIARQMEELRRTLPTRFRQLRAEFLDGAAHLRQPAQIAHLLIGLETFLEFAVEADALTAEERTRRIVAARGALVRLAHEHGKTLREDDPVSLFLALLRDGIASQRVYLEDEKGGPPPDAQAWGWTVDSREGVPAAPNGRRVGFVDEHWVRLIPEEAYGFVVEAARRTDRSFPVEARTLWRRLDEAKLLATQIEGEGDAAYRRRIVKERVEALGGKDARVLKLSRAKFVEAPLPPTTGNTGNSLGDLLSAIPVVPGAGRQESRDKSDSRAGLSPELSYANGSNDEPDEWL